MKAAHVVFGSWIAMIGASVGCSPTTEPNSGPRPSSTGGNTGSGTGGTTSSSSGGSNGAAGSGGTTATGSGGNSGTGGSTTSSGGSTGGGAGGSNAGSGGSSGDANAPSEGGLPPADTGTPPTSDGDTPPARPLNVTAAKMRLSHTFRAKAADPAVSFNDNNQVSMVDPRSTKMVGKLVLPFGGVGTNSGIIGPAGEFLAARGYHILGIAAFQDYNIIRDDADFWGDARRTVFEGKKYTTKYEFASINITPADGVAMRTEKALKYLHEMFPAEDWGYFLNADGSVRWSDVIFTGMSHGASNAARFAMLVRSAGAVSFAGPRDNTCNSTNTASCNANFAKWFTEVPKTPIDRFYAVTGMTDEQYPQHLYTMHKMNYVGQPTNGSTGSPPYNNSHRITMNGGHDWFCNNSLRNLCNYLFKVPPENQAGIP